jgi:uncharacterized protein with HEPN domain
MRREELYLRDIVEAADAVQRFIADVEEENFFEDELRQSAVLQKLMLIGEATARLPESFRARYPTIPWVDIIGFRNIAIHEYFSVDWSIVWTTATKDVPELRSHIADILDREFGTPI